MHNSASFSVLYFVSNQGKKKKKISKNELQEHYRKCPEWRMSEGITPYFLICSTEHTQKKLHIHHFSEAQFIGVIEKRTIIRVQQ